MLHINHLQSGGLITNYSCSSRCGHCLYACSPKRSKEYISNEQARDNFRYVKRMGCHSLHIGGGEPFLLPSRLLEVTSIAQSEGIFIEYIETNASWFTRPANVIAILNELKNSGIHTLLISISPFHNEHIPFSKVTSLIDACNKTGIRIFPWMETFIKDHSAMRTQRTHTLSEFKALYGNDYVQRIPLRYWIHVGGRALQTFSNELPLRNFDDLINSCRPCNELADTSHFHIDLYGKYIPGLCSGFGLDVSIISDTKAMKKYQLIDLLYTKGIAALFEHIRDRYNYTPEDQYLNKCHLCTDIRKFLVERNIHFEELHPLEFYSELNQ